MNSSHVATSNEEGQVATLEEKDSNGMFSLNARPKLKSNFYLNSNFVINSQ